MAGFAYVAAEARELAATGLSESDLAALLRRLDDGLASEADRARLAGFSLQTLRTVVTLNASV